MLLSGWVQGHQTSTRKAINSWLGKNFEKHQPLKYTWSQYTAKYTIYTGLTKVLIPNSICFMGLKPSLFIFILDVDDQNRMYMSAYYGNWVACSNLKFQ